MKTLGEKPMSEQNREASPCPECGTPRLVLDRAIEFWISGSHQSKLDPCAFVCPQCGHIAFYATAATLAKISQVMESNEEN